MARFTAQDLIACYAQGVFPMGEARDDPRLFLVEPEQRGVIPLDGFRFSRRLARTLRQDPFEVRVDTAFHQVVALCAEPRPGHPETWINAPIRKLYGELFDLGRAHSLECWLGDALVGGLYGVSLGGAFFGESMFSLVRDASKIALAHLVARLRLGGYALLDCQFQTEHLSQFGCLEIDRAEYKLRLSRALRGQGDYFAAGALTGAEVLQAISHRS
jgi:leucyl/phenylalanyl-tRNA--protein transferase